MMTDCYLTQEYGRACEIADNKQWMVSRSIDDKYLPYMIDSQGNISSPYGYSGYVNGIPDDFIELVDKTIRSGKTVTLRLCPYRNNTPIHTRLNLIHTRLNLIHTRLNLIHTIVSKVTYGVCLKSFDSYWKSSKGSHRRCVRKAIKCGYKCTNEIATDDDFIPGSIFLEIYKHTMDRVTASDCYYYTPEYYQQLLKIPGKIMLSKVRDATNTIVAIALIIECGQFIHYHLGGSLTGHIKNGINNLLHHTVIQYGCSSNDLNLYHVGGGLRDGDHLSRFKRSFSNKT